MTDELFTALFVFCLLYLYCAAGGVVIWLADKALSFIPRYRDWKENLIDELPDWDDE